MTELSHIGKANQQSSSARTTIPKSIMAGLELQIGDVISWELVDNKKGRTIAHVKKVKMT